MNTSITSSPVNPYSNVLDSPCLANFTINEQQPAIDESCYSVAGQIICQSISLIAASYRAGLKVEMNPNDTLPKAAITQLGVNVASSYSLTDGKCSGAFFHQHAKPSSNTTITTQVMSSHLCPFRGDLIQTEGSKVYFDPASVLTSPQMPAKRDLSALNLIDGFCLPQVFGGRRRNIAFSSLQSMFIGPGFGSPPNKLVDCSNKLPSVFAFVKLNCTKSCSEIGPSFELNKGKFSDLPDIFEYRVKGVLQKCFPQVFSKSDTTDYKEYISKTPDTVEPVENSKANKASPAIISAIALTAALLQ